mgnify:CR=1 FL=1
MWEVSNMQKTEQKTEQQAGLGMSFCEEEGRITVFRKTLEALEWPSHYRFLYNRKMKQIAVQMYEREEGCTGVWSRRIRSASCGKTRRI